jgi:hypothetical protein
VKYRSGIGCQALAAFVDVVELEFREAGILPGQFKEPLLQHVFLHGLYNDKDRRLDA